MPVIFPPPLLDVPAIVRVAAHSTGTPIAIQRPVIKPRRIEQPADTVQAPTVVGPVSPPPPAKAAPGAARRVERPAGTVQAPDIVGPVPPPPPPPATTTPGVATSQGAPSQTNAERHGR
jgi:hypothetical protein